jgi:SAM-dependent methyltransferase
MPKQGEIDYLKNFGEAGVAHAVDKPFSDDEFSKHLIDLGVVASLLPPLPARVLDLGCGSGWTSCFLAKRGYQVVGQDIAPDMIELARRNQRRYQIGDNLSFLVADYEETEFADEFDGAIFFDALHHAVDEEAALRTAYRALRPGGVCITSEPGEGHSCNPHTLEAVERFHVTEKDMPIHRIIQVGKKVGFKEFHSFPHLSQWASVMHRPSSVSGPMQSVPKQPTRPQLSLKASLRSLLRSFSLVRSLKNWYLTGGRQCDRCLSAWAHPSMFWAQIRETNGGVVVMRK